MDVQKLIEQLDAKKADGLALIAKHGAAADKDGRELTAEERAEIKAVSDDCLALKGRITRAQSDADQLGELERITHGLARQQPPQLPAAPHQAGGPRRVHLSMGEQFVQSEAFQFFKKGLHRTSSAWRSPAVELYRAETLTEDPASGGSLVQPQYLAGILPLPQRPLVVADLLASGTTDSNLVTYQQEKVWINAADTVLEGGIKPESKLTFAPVSDAVRKIAHWLPVSEEMLEDVAQIRSYIDARLQLGVKQAEDDQLLNGSGVAPDLLGLMLRAGLAADVVRTDPANNADAIFMQIMAIFATSYLLPDGITMHPSNWAGTLLMKSNTGEYLTAGPFSAIQTPTLWGLPVAVTPAIAAGTSLVGVYKTGAQVFRHGGIRVEASNSHADFFIKNLVAIRAEERLALAVYRPGAFGKVTGLTGQAGLGTLGSREGEPNGKSASGRENEGRDDAGRRG